MNSQDIWDASQASSAVTECGGPTKVEAVHLITILYKSERSLPTFLDSLQAQDLKGWRLHVIDNASPDSSLRIVTERGDPRITVISNEKNLGFAKAANQGMRAAIAAGGEFLVLINNDTVFSPDFLRRLVAVRSGLPAGVIAPRVMYREQPDKSWYAGGSLDNGWLFTNVHHEYSATNSSAAVEVDFAPGCCLGMSQEVLRKIGLLDESFFVYWEDVDFSLRLTKAGIKIFYVPEPFLLHSGGESSGGERSPAYMRLYYRSYMQVLRKHFGLRRAIGTMVRLLLVERNRKKRNLRVISIMARAMVLGLSAPMVPQVGLDENG
jgi:GT2 family glycosyltransferase